MEDFESLPAAMKDEFHEYTQIYDEIRHGAGDYFRLLGLTIP